jgi:muramoyltetrapeptide carboxypeptidase LdcA involved in peptidoglycan recycling
VVAPSNSLADMPRELREVGRRNLGALGFEVGFGAHVDARHLHAGGTVEERVADLHDAFADPQVDVVMAAFGGYNSNQLLPHLDYDSIGRSGKPFVGYSDATALLAAIADRAGTPAVHGPAFGTFCDPAAFAYTGDGLRRVLAGERTTFRAPRVAAADLWYLKPGFGPREEYERGAWRVMRRGEATAAIVGGNLETLCALAGTPWFPETGGCLLFVEDTWGRSPGAFHRSLTQLRQLGALDHIRGLMVGSVPPGSALDSSPLVEAMLADVLPPRTDYPVVYDVNCSHVDPMMSIPLREQATLAALDDASLTIAAARPRIPERRLTPC